MLLGMHAKKGVGKDTAYQRIANMYAHEASPYYTGGIPVYRKSFADLLYKSAAGSTGLNESDIRAFVRDPNVRIEVYRYQNRKGPRGGRRIHAFTFRQFLQWYGTEGHRQVFSENFWTDAVDLSDHDGRIVVVTDVRFDNEAAAVRSAGGHVVRLIGPTEIEESGDGHASESGLTPELIDFTVDNSDHGSFERLDEQLRDLVNGLLDEDESHNESIGEAQDDILTQYPDAIPPRRES